MQNESLGAAALRLSTTDVAKEEVEWEESKSYYVLWNGSN